MSKPSKNVLNTIAVLVMVFLVGSIVMSLGGAVYFGVIGNGFGEQKENTTVKQDINTNISDDVRVNSLTDGSSEVIWSSKGDADRIVIKDKNGNVTEELLFQGHEERIIIEEYNIYAVYDDTNKSDVLIHRKVNQQKEQTNS